MASALDNADGDAWQVSMVTATDGWAVGPEVNTLLHYNGQRWVTVPLAADKNATFQISRLRMVSATDGWAVGIVETMIPQPGSTLSFLISRTPLILHYQHGTWSVLPTS